ncbi:hypothetical protein ACU4GR_07420 [Methylobacterium oryzae CBMB20]
MLILVRKRGPAFEEVIRALKSLGVPGRRTGPARGLGPHRGGRPRRRRAGRAACRPTT